jgi:hypothetical protein
VCRGPRTYRGFAYYLNLYWRCVRQALGQPVSNPPTIEEQRDFSTLNRILVQAYKPFIQNQVKDLEYPVGIPQEIQSGQIDCHTDDNAASTVFERLLTPEAAAALFGNTAFGQHSREPIFRACRCYCICALEFGCCLAQARTLLEALRCLEDFFCCLQRCFEPLIAVLDTPPACSSLTLACGIQGIEVTGTAAGAAFTSYTLTYSITGPIINDAVVYPDCSTPPLNPSSSTPVTSGVLGYLDSFLLPIGTTSATVYLDVYGSGGLHLQVSAVFQFEIQYIDITQVGLVPTFTGPDPFSTAVSPPAIKMLQNVLPGFAGFERSVGGNISVTGSAYANGCGNIIAQYQLAQFLAPGAEPLPATPIVPGPTALGGTSLIPVPVVYDGTSAHPFSSPCSVSNIILGGNLVAEWELCTPPFPPGWGWIDQFNWGSSPNGRCVIFLEVDQYSIATPHTPMVLAGDDQVAVWIDNWTPVALITQVGNVTGCVGALHLKDYVGTTAPVNGIAWDFPIDITATQKMPNDNFGSYGMSYQKNGVPTGASFQPSDYTPNGTPAGTSPTVRVPNFWQAAAPTPGQAALLASWDVVGALDGGPPADPTQPCVPSPATPWQLPRGCQCAYIIFLSVVDTTLIDNSAGNNNKQFWYPFNVINDIVSADYTGSVNTSGAAVTWVSGMHFQLWWAAGSKISINGTTYTILSVSSATSITLTTSAGTQNGVPYAYSS